MSTRAIVTVISFCIVFFGLMSVVGNVHVAEFYGILGCSTIGAIVVWFKLGRLALARKKISSSDFN
jgi:hypothetical protein